MATPFDTRPNVQPEIVELPSYKQLMFLKSLISQRAWATLPNIQYVARIAEIRDAIETAMAMPNFDSDYAGAMVNAAIAPGRPVDRKGISVLIDGLLSLPYSASPTTADDGDSVEGFWVLDGDIIKVQIAVHGSGNPYAKRLDPETGKYEYVRGLIREIQSGSATRLTLDHAKELGHLYGRCVCCGATLTDEKSIEAGVGPVCASKL